MDELDQLLQELSVPKAIEKPAPQPVNVPQPTRIQETAAPRPQTVDFGELDNLMADLSGPGGRTSAAVPRQSMSQQQSYAQPQSTFSQPSYSQQAPAGRESYAPSMGGGRESYAAPSISGGRDSYAPRQSYAQGGGGGSTVDDLLAELSNPGTSQPAYQSAPAQVTYQPTPVRAPAASQEADELDNVMNALQGATPASGGGGQGFNPNPAPSSRKNELDNILNSLSSEMNQIGVDSDFKGQCSRCKKAILGQVVTAIGKTWHPECFSCYQCRKPLSSSSFFEKEANPYCEKCFHDFFSPKCAYCDGPIRDKCINALGRTWHPDHFFCSQCGKNFAGGGFMEKDGKAYCEEDYFNMFAPKCGGCEKPIMADCITALGRQWHPNCFVCMECKQSFGGGSFFDYEGKPYCEKHYHSQRGSLCASCLKPVLGRCITAIGKRFHPEHFVCAFCMKQLAQGTFKENGGKPYCLGCHVKLFG